MSIDKSGPQDVSEGTIVIRWKLVDSTDKDGELDWAYEPSPPIPDELGERLLREIADRL